MNSYIFDQRLADKPGRTPPLRSDDVPGECCVAKEGNPWTPFSPSRLPGVQVVISAHNAESWLHRCLASVERALEGFRWVLVVADDGSTDDTLKFAVNHPSHAAHMLIRSYPKAANVSVAKNRAFAMTRRYEAEFPAIVPMDADDEMTEERVMHLLPRAVRGGHRAVMGDYQYHCPHLPERHLQVVPARAENVDLGIFGPPMILFHVSLIPPDGRLFREDMSAYSDAALWHDWRAQGIEIHPLPGPVVHLYHYREGSTSNPTDKERRQRNIRHFIEVRDGQGPKTELARPLVSALMLTGKCPERYPLARVAIRCFLEQTWPEKELVIINHGETPLANGDPRIREILIHRPPAMTLGDLRNLAREHARGDYVVQWDDDDYHHPRRIETMMCWRDAGDVVTLRWQLRFNLRTGTAYYHHLDGGQHMTILHRAGVPFRYPKLNVAEDTLFLRQFHARHVIDNTPDEPPGPLLYVRLFHGRNVWDEAHIMRHMAGRKGVLAVSAEHQARLHEIRRLYESQPDFAPDS